VTVSITRPDTLEGAAIARVRELAEAATETDGSAPLGEHILMRLDGSGPHLVVEDGDRIVGYAQLDPAGERPTAELVVHPDARRRGIGRTLVRELLSAASPNGLQIWAHGELPGAVVLAKEFDFRQVRSLLQLHRSLTDPPLPPVELPVGVLIRSFRLGEDDDQFLRVNNAAFHWHPEQGGWGSEQLAERAREPWFDPEGFLLAVEPAVSAGGGEPASDSPRGERLLGFHWTKVHGAPNAEDRMGEVYVVGVDPAAQGRRLGAVLTLAGLHYLRERGLPAVMLYVEADNVAAVRTYEKLGFTRWHSDAAFARP
jgi:mycothiol synthase